MKISTPPRNKLTRFAAYLAIFNSQYDYLRKGVGLSLHTSIVVAHKEAQLFSQKYSLIEWVKHCREMARFWKAMYAMYQLRKENYQGPALPPQP